MRSYLETIFLAFALQAFLLTLTLTECSEEEESGKDPSGKVGPPHGKSGGIPKAKGGKTGEKGADLQASGRESDGKCMDKAGQVRMPGECGFQCKYEHEGGEICGHCSGCCCSDQNQLQIRPDTPCINSTCGEKMPATLRTEG